MKTPSKTRCYAIVTALFSLLQLSHARFLSQFSVIDQTCDPFRSQLGQYAAEVVDLIDVAQRGTANFQGGGAWHLFHFFGLAVDFQTFKLRDSFLEQVYDTIQCKAQFYGAAVKWTRLI